jgi:3,2-trans-enoyl-CoA isomerase
MLDIINHEAGPGNAGFIREIRLARPPVNALEGGLLRALIDAVAGAQQAAAIVVSGQPGVFSAGLDVPALLSLDRQGLINVFSLLWQAQRAIATSTVPVVFALTGHCPAGGTVLAIHGDHRVMATGDFRIGLNEVQVGLFPGPVIYGAFRRLVGGHAEQLLTRAALIDPGTALRVGLVDELCEASRCIDRALEIARDYGALPREPLRLTREMVRRELVALFGDAGDAQRISREFAETGADLWCVPATQERLRQMFSRRSAAR